MAAPRIRVLIVDDSALMRELLVALLSRDPEIEIVSAVADPLAAVARLKQSPVDVVTLDVEMPRMDGLTFLEKLMRAFPLPVVMISSLTERGAATTFRALELGAVDFVAKPRLDVQAGTEEMGAEILRKVKGAARARVRPRLRPILPHAAGTSGSVAPRNSAPSPLAGSAIPSATAAAAGMAGTVGAVGIAGTVGAAGSGVNASAGAAALVARDALIKSTHKVVAIGASTGGTEALRELLCALPPDSPGIVIVQHMPARFTQSFAQRLDGLAAVRVREAHDGDRVLPGHVLIAPGDFHMEVTRSGAHYGVRVFSGDPVNHHRPSVDILFESCARYLGANAVGIIMTGMGADGATGLRSMHTAGAHTIAQDEQSCVVFGMPKEAIALGAVDAVLGLEQIPAALLRAAASH